MAPHPLQFVKDQWIWYAAPGSDTFGAHRINKIRRDFSLELHDLKKKPVKVPYKVLVHNPNCVCPLPDPTDGSEPGKYTAKDLSTLSRASLADIESCIRNQFSMGLLYTTIRKNVTLHINPNRKMDIYNDVFADRYSELDPSLPPHIFNLAAITYKSLVQDEASQVIMMVGDPGSGKSQASNHILHFLTKICVMDDKFGKKCEAVPIVLNAFLSAVLDSPDDHEKSNVSPKNRWSSSRALTALQLAFDDQGFIVSGHVDVPFYERSRASRPQNGRNFNVFYYYMALTGIDEWIGADRDFPIAPFGDSDFTETDAKNAKEFAAALELLEINKDEIFRALAAMLLLSNIVVSEDEDTGAVFVEAFDEHCIPLQTDVETLCDALVRKTVAETQDAIRRLIGDMYDVLLGQILLFINDQIVGEEEGGASITLVDAPSPAAGKVPTGAFDSFVFNWINDKVVSMHVDAIVPSRGLDSAELEPRKCARESLETVKMLVDGVSRSIKRNDAASDKEIAAALVRDPASGNKIAETKLFQANGNNAYEIDSTFIYNARGGHSSDDVMEIISTAGLELEPRPRGLDEATNCIDFLEGLLSGEVGVVRTVVCLRVNRTGSKVELDRSLLKDQLRNFGVEAIVNFSNSGRNLSVVKDLNTFLNTYSPKGKGTLAERTAAFVAQQSWTYDVQIGEQHLYGPAHFDKLLGSEGQEVVVSAASSPSASSRPERTGSPRANGDGKEKERAEQLAKGERESDGDKKDKERAEKLAKGKDRESDGDVQGRESAEHLAGKDQEAKSVMAEASLKDAIDYLKSLEHRIDVTQEVTLLERLATEMSSAMENRDPGKLHAAIERSEGRQSLLRNFQRGIPQRTFLGGHVATRLPTTNPSSRAEQTASRGLHPPQLGEDSWNSQLRVPYRPIVNLKDAKAHVGIPCQLGEKHVNQVQQNMTGIINALQSQESANARNVLHSEVAAIENECEGWRRESQRLRQQLHGLQHAIKEWSPADRQFPMRKGTRQQQETLRNALEVLHVLTEMLAPHREEIFPEERLMTREQQIVHHFLKEVSSTREQIQKARLLSTECGLPWRL